jgi:hypothetical protein
MQTRRPARPAACGWRCGPAAWSRPAGGPAAAAGAGRRPYGCRAGTAGANGIKLESIADLRTLVCG